MEVVYLGIAVAEPFIRINIEDIHTGQRFKRICYTQEELLANLSRYIEMPHYKISLYDVKPLKGEL